jgi:hypothetical protein
VTAAELCGWRDAFLVAGEASLKTRPVDNRDVEIGRLKAKIGDLTMANELLAMKIEHLGGWPPFGTAEVEAMSRVVSSSTNRSYDVLRVTRVWGTSRVTVYRHRRCDNPASGVGQARSGRCPTRRWSRRSASCWPRARSTARATARSGRGWRFAGIRTSKRRVLRLMRAHDLLAPGRVGQPHGPKAHDGTLRTEQVDERWGTDLTSTLTGEGRPRSSSRSTTPRPGAWAFTPPAARPGSRRSSRSARCAPPAAPSPRALQKWSAG